MKIYNLKNRKVNIFGCMLMMALLYFPATAVSAQSANEEVVPVADVMPAFPGGQKALMQFVHKQMVYPEDAISKGVEGKVTVKFVVTKEGKVTNPSISKGLYPSVDQAVLDVVAKLPKFEPATIAGKPVNCWFAFPVSFELQQL